MHCALSHGASELAGTLTRFHSLAVIDSSSKHRPIAAGLPNLEVSLSSSLLFLFSFLLLPLELDPFSSDVFAFFESRQLANKSRSDEILESWQLVHVPLLLQRLDVLADSDLQISKVDGRLLPFFSIFGLLVEFKNAQHIEHLRLLTLQVEVSPLKVLNAHFRLSFGHGLLLRDVHSAVEVDFS